MAASAAEYWACEAAGAAGPIQPDLNGDIGVHLAASALERGSRSRIPVDRDHDTRPYDEDVGAQGCVFLVGDRDRPDPEVP
jgi:hypothetical protein